MIFYYDDYFFFSRLFPLSYIIFIAESPTVALLGGGVLYSEINIGPKYYYTWFPPSNELSNVVTGVIFVVLGALVVSLQYRFLEMAVSSALDLPQS